MSPADVYEAMSTTRAVRRLRPDAIPDDVLRRVLEAATWGPTGGNRQPWRVIAVREAAKKRELQKLYEGPWRAYTAPLREMIAQSPQAIAVRDVRTLAAADHLAEHLGEAPVILVFCFDPSMLAITDAGLDRPAIVGGASVYPSVQNTLLACRAEGLGCTLTTLLCMCEPQVKELLAIPAGWGTCAFVPIGYPVGRGHGPLTRRPVEDVAYGDTWGQPLW